MMYECPFCSDDFGSEDDLTAHVLVAHPEKTTSAEAFGKVMEGVSLRSELLNTAGNLTALTVGRDGAPQKDVWKHFIFFVEKLESWRPRWWKER